MASHQTAVSGDKPFAAVIVGMHDISALGVVCSRYIPVFKPLHELLIPLRVFCKIRAARIRMHNCFNLNAKVVTGVCHHGAFPISDGEKIALHFG